MRRLITLAALFSVPACSCFENAYNDYCAGSPLCDGGTTGGGTTTGGGGGGTAAGGGAAMGGGSALGGGTGQGGGTGPGGGGAPGGGPGGGATGGGSGIPDSGTGGNAEPTSLTLTVPASVKAGACGPAAILLMNGSGLATSANATSVSIDNGSGLVHFYAGADTTCTGTELANPVVIPAGSSSQPINYESMVFGQGQLQISDLGTVLQGATETVQVTALARLISIGHDIVPAAGTCSSLFEVKIVDEGTKSISIPAYAAATVEFTTSGSTKFTYGADDASCPGTTNAFSGMMAKGNSTMTLYAGYASSTCGDSALLGFDVSMLPNGLTADPGAQNATVYYSAKPNGIGCTSATECCSGSCSADVCAN